MQHNPRYSRKSDLGPVAGEHYEIARSFGFGWFERTEFIDRYTRRHPERPRTSIQPADFRFNEPSPSKSELPHFLEWDGASRYRFVGLDGTGSGREFVVLVENHGSKYDDITGKQYDYPDSTGYHRLIRPGVGFVYYRGTAGGGPHYFGRGVISSTALKRGYEGHPERKRRFLAEIAEYEPFSRAVPLRGKNSRPFESSSVRDNGTWKGGNFYRRAVRPLAKSDFDRICEWGEMTEPGGSQSHARSSPRLQLELHHVLKPRATGKCHRPGGSSLRRSTHAKTIGDAAERLVYDWLHSEEAQRELGVDLSRGVQWDAQLGRAPGWDITYWTEEGIEHGVEVKGTSGAGMSSVEVTANEWNAAERLDNRYILLLISGIPEKPRMQIIRNPRSVDALSASVATWTLRLER